jgi:exonuclease SbcC
LRRAAGLDLAVFDELSGKERPAGTLSGGEGFQASLALALGMAEAVQAHAGGVRLETIFIDEGFGTLDPDSLEAAIGTLLELANVAAGQGRLVGIISHVPELQRRIDARLEVVPGERGSTARFVV